MSVISKEDQIIATQATHTDTLASIIAAVQAIPGANSQPVLDAIAKAQASLDSLSTTVGTETPSPTPAPTPAP